MTTSHTVPAFACDPDFLYRYRSFAESERKYLEETIVENKLYFPPPAGFNDPFDCKPTFSLEGTDRDKRKYAEKLLKRSPQLSRADRRKHAATFFSGVSLRSLQQSYHAAITKQIGVLCLSEEPDIHLMWSHYADKHQGICLVFDSKTPFFASSQPVIYKDARPALNPLLQTPDEMMESSVLTKAKKWGYEKEWRLINHESGPGKYPFPAAALVAVILGAQFDRDNLMILKSWLKRRPEPLQLFQAKLSQETFSLSVEQIER